jgi:hypothetical protein
MKTITKLSALCVVALGLCGCAENNEAVGQKDPVTGKTTAPGVTPVSAPKSSADFMKKTAANNPMTNNPAYKDAGK